jgi:hypothetical protein
VLCENTALRLEGRIPQKQRQTLCAISQEHRLNLLS